MDVREWYNLRAPYIEQLGAKSKLMLNKGWLQLSVKKPYESGSLTKFVPFEALETATCPDTYLSDTIRRMQETAAGHRMPRMTAKQERHEPATILHEDFPKLFESSGTAADRIREKFGEDTHIEPGQDEDGTINGRFL